MHRLFHLPVFLGLFSLGCDNSSTAPEQPLSPGNPYSFRIAKAMPDSLTVGTTDTVTVQVLNKAGVPVPGVRVFFSVTGSGTASPASITTDHNGMASTAWTMGTNAYEECEMVATVGPAGNPQLMLTLYTDARAGPVTRGELPDKYNFVKLGDVISIASVLYDVYQNPVASSQANLVTRNSAVATVDALGRIVGVGVGQTVIAATTPSGVIDSAVVVVMPSMGAIGTNLTQFEYTAGTLLNMAVVAYPTQPATRPIGSATIRLSWDPALLTYQPQASLPSNPDIVVNTTEASTGRLTFSFASVAGMSGSAQLLNVLFSASSTVGKRGAISVEILEMSVAGTFQDVTTSTYGFSQFIRLR